MEDEWTVVGRKGKPKGQPKTSKGPFQPQNPHRTSVAAPRQAAAAAHSKRGPQSRASELQATPAVQAKQDNALQEASHSSSEPVRGSSESADSGAAASSINPQPGSNGTAPSSANSQPHGNSTAPHSGWSTRPLKPRRARTPKERARDLIGHISLAKEEILKSDFWRELQRRMQQAEEDAVEAAPSSSGCTTWDEIEEVVVLGLGSLEARHAPRYQLALALLLAEGFERLAAPVQLRDPVFTELDRKVLEDSGCQVLDTDEAAFKAVSRPTLFYLPHCPASMSHNLVAANWQPSALPRLAMLGNGFVATAAACNDVSAPRKEGGPLSEAILELVGADAVVDVPVKECNFPVRGAFNDTSVMLFSPSDELLAGKMQPLDLSHLL